MRNKKLRKLLMYKLCCLSVSIMFDMSIESMLIVGANWLDTGIVAQATLSGGVKKAKCPWCELIDNPLCLIVINRSSIHVHFFQVLYRI